MIYLVFIILDLKKLMENCQDLLNERGMNVISIQKKFIFIHVPKTGGNSLQKALKMYSEDILTTNDKNQDGIERFGIINIKYKTKKHSPLSYYNSVMEKSLFRKLFKFAVIRNPWERMISLYFSAHRGLKIEWNRNKFLEMVYRAKPLRYFISSNNERVNEIDKCQFHNKQNSKPLDSDIDFLIRYERLNDDFEKVCKILDIPPKSLKVLNQSKREHYSIYYDDDLIDLIKRKFREEIIYGKYQFQKNN